MSYAQPLRNARLLPIAHTQTLEKHVTSSALIANNRGVSRFFMSLILYPYSFTHFIFTDVYKSGHTHLPWYACGS